MKKFLISAIAILALASCSEKRFHIEGNIANAKDSVVYFENIGLAGPEVLDSAKLGDDGAFSFSGERTEAPEFYRLRINDQIISLCIDSTETVTVKAQWPQMASQYEVSGSDNCLVMKELALKQMSLQQRALQVSRDATLSVDQMNDSLLSMINAYKKDVKANYIFKNPAKPYAYFALFQTMGNMLLFNPRTNRDDIKAFAAVATSWDAFWPEAERGRNLHNIAIEGMKNIRTIDAENSKAIDISKVQATGLIDIALRDNKGQIRRLTDLKGKVVLLDFHLFAMDESPTRILLLRELYNKYHDQGLEIYQVSIDGDEHFWKQQTAALPWISVREERGVNSSTLQLYNVRGIPDFFLIDRDNNIVGRSATMKDVEQDIRRLL
jgi:peroxiredoxin